MHKPVLKEEVINYLDPKPNENFIDATYGLGGHSRAILEKNNPKGKILAIEADKELFQMAKKQNRERLILVNNSFLNLKEIVERYDFKPIQGILFDLGMSSWHLERSGRGFSFRKSEPLDMRFNNDSCLRAEEIINKWAKEQIEKILREYGEERFSRRIAEAIVQHRAKKPIKTASELADIVKRAMPLKFQEKRIHPATKTFQALRIAVNNELENIKQALPQAIEVLEKRGKIAVISFHSLEDRIVKNFFKEQAKKGIVRILTKKPVVPGGKEIAQNPCSRSAKMRVAQKI